MMEVRWFDRDPGDKDRVLVKVAVGVFHSLTLLEKAVSSFV